MFIISHYFRKKFPVVRQQETTDCAPAALLSILKYYKAPMSLYQLRTICKTGSNGTSLLDLKNAAAILGFRAIGATGSYAQLKEQQPPFIAHITDRSKEHYIVIYRINNYWLLAGDPARGLRIISKTNFEQKWRSHVVLLLWPAEKIKTEEMVRSPKYLKYLFKREKVLIFQGVFLGIVSTLSGLFIALYIHYLIDVVIPGSDIKQLKLSAIILLVLFIISALALLFRQRIMVYFLYRAGNTISFRFQNHLYRLPKRFFDSYILGDIIVRLNDVMKIPIAAMIAFGTIIIDIFMVLAVISGLFLLNAQIAGVLTLIIPVNFIVIMIFSRQISRDQQQIVYQNSILQDKFIDTFRGIDDIISYNAQSLFSGDNMRSLKKLQTSVRTMGIHRSSFGFSAELFRAFSTTFVLLSGAMIIMQSGMMIGQVIACYYLLTNMMPALTRLGETSVTIREASIAWKRLLEIWQIPAERVTRGKRIRNFKSLKLINGVFSWAGAPPLWAGVSLIIARGSMIALTGPSGAGKTTLLHVLHRKYNLNGGKIHLDNQPVSDFRLKDFRRRVTLVPQKIHIFKAPLIQNILLGRPDWYIDDLFKEYTFSDWISRFEQGLTTVLGDGNRSLSGGEKQMIGLMRALYARPDILLIDESLNSVDPETQECMIYSLKLFAREGGVLLCTHEKKIILQMDEIYVLKKGEIFHQRNFTDTFEQYPGKDRHPLHDNLS